MLFAFSVAVAGGSSFNQASINLEKIKLENMKRVMSFTYQSNKKCIYFRHYKLVFEEGGVEDQERFAGCEELGQVLRQRADCRGSVPVIGVSDEG